MGGGHKLQYPTSRDYLMPKMNNGTPNYMGVSPNAGSTYESSMIFQGSSHNQTNKLSQSDYGKDVFM